METETTTTTELGGYEYTDSANTYIPQDGTTGGYAFEGSDNSLSDCLCPQPFSAES